MRTITTAGMLKILGQYIVKNENEFKTATANSREIEKARKLPYVLGFNSWLIFANEYKAISIVSVSNFYKVYTRVESPDTELRQFNISKEFFCFNQESADEAIAKYAEVHKSDSQEQINEWINDNLYLVDDYSDNFALIKNACLEINWYMTHNTIGDLKNFLNKRHYRRIIDMAKEWAAQ